MGGKAPRRKGDSEERAIVAQFQNAGIFAERVPLSGAAGGSYTGDLTVAVLNEDWLSEVKVRDGMGFKLIYGWLSDNRLLFIRANHNEGLVVLRRSDLLRLIRAVPHRDYDPKADGAKSYDQGIKAIRERLVKSRQIKPDPHEMHLLEPEGER